MGAGYYERIGVSFETPNHYLKLTALESLAYFRSLYSRETQAPHVLLEMVNLTDDGDMLVSQYSKGMKTRLSVARSLLHNPDNPAPSAASAPAHHSPDGSPRAAAD